MQHFFLLILLGFLTGTLFAENTPELKRISLEVAGQTRSALLYEPEKPVEPLPLVFVFHGHGGSSEKISRSIAMHTHWPEALVLYPQGVTGHKGITDPKGERTGWQKNAGELADADLRFFDALLEKAQEKRKIDLEHIHVMGHSNGSRFACLLWSLRGEHLASISSSGGHAAGLLKNAPQRPVFMIAGKTDKIVPYEAQKQSMALILEHLTLGKPASTEAEVTTYRREDGLEAVTYIHDGGHAYPVAAIPKVAAFFKKHRKPEQK